MRRFLFLVLLSLLLILIDKKGWDQGPKSLIERPFVWAEERIFAAFRKTEEAPVLSEEKLRQLAVAQNDLQSCQEENTQMRKLLGAPLPPQWKFLDARVIGLVAGRLRINKGQTEGVKDQSMVVSENILVGKVVSLGANDAWVQTVASSESKIPVVVKRPFDSAQGKAGIQARGLLIFQNSELILDRVLQSEDIQKGDLIVTAGEAGWLPDLLIGHIAEVLPKTAAVYQKAKVEPLIDNSKLRIVFVVR